MPDPEPEKTDEPRGTRARGRVIKRLRRSGGGLSIEYADEILPEDLPERMRMGEAVAFLAQHLSASPATLYRAGVVARIPVVYLKTRRLRDGTEEPSEMRVPRDGLLRLLEEIVGEPPTGA